MSAFSFAMHFDHHIVLVLILMLALQFHEEDPAEVSWR